MDFIPVDDVKPRAEKAKEAFLRGGHPPFGGPGKGHQGGGGGGGQHPPGRPGGGGQPQISDRERTERYVSTTQRITKITAIALWCLGVYFNMTGFGLRQTDPKQWFVVLAGGLILAVTVTVVELNINRNGLKTVPTLLVAGLFIYAFGIWTNISGFARWMGIYDIVALFRSSPQDTIIPITVGVIMEIVPEPLFLSGSGIKGGGDLVGGLMKIFKAR